LRAAATAIASPVIDTISNRLSRASTSRASLSLSSLCNTSHSTRSRTTISSAPSAAFSRRTWRCVPAIKEVDPDGAADNDHLVPRPLRLGLGLPRQRYLPKAMRTYCCGRSLIIRRSASSTVCFLGRLAGNLLRFGHQGIIDVDIDAHRWHSDRMCINGPYNTHDSVASPLWAASLRCGPFSRRSQGKSRRRSR
jgi:hypothetical protein